MGGSPAERMRELLAERARGTLGPREQIELAHLLIQHGDAEVPSEKDPPSYLVVTNVMDPPTIAPPTTEPLTRQPSTAPLPNTVKLTLPMNERPAAGLSVTMPVEPTIAPRIVKAPVRTTLNGSMLDGKYLVGRILGEGGFGVVYEGTHTLLDERVAIKCMRGAVPDRKEHEANIAQFLREARVLFSLAHPGIVRLYDIGKLTENGVELPYVVLERVDGISLQLEIAKRLREKRHFTVQEIGDLAQELLSALAYAHESGVAHRDLKPSNILIAHPHQRANGFKSKLVDFGIARWLDEMHLVGSMSAYSPMYAAPEQMQTGAVTGERVDVFAAAIVLTEVCTLRPVVNANTPLELYEALKGKRTIEIGKTRPELPPVLEEVLRRAVSLDPAERQANARELFEDVMGALGRRALSVKPKPPLKPIEEDDDEKTEWDGAQKIGRYELGPLLATGGMGKVHLAVLRGVDSFAKVVVAKRILTDVIEEKDAVKALRDEARVASRVVHANVVQLLDVVETKGEIALIFEYILGATLREIAAESKKPPPLPIVSSIVSSVLRGLHAAHVATAADGQPLGLVHRDVAPENIIVGADGLARVLDFGVARANRRRTVTERKVVKGRLGYMSMEQLEGQPATPRADIHAAGVVLWELCTGTRLFDGPTDAAVLVARTQSYLPPSPLLHREDLPAKLVQCIMQAIQPAADDRYATAAEMAIALETAVPPATAGQVADWLNARCKTLLDRRLSERATVESLYRVSLVDVSVRMIAPPPEVLTLPPMPSSPPPVASVVPAPSASSRTVPRPAAPRPVIAGIAVGLAFVATLTIGLVFWLARVSKNARAEADAGAVLVASPPSASASVPPDPPPSATGSSPASPEVGQHDRMPSRPRDPKHGNRK